MKIPSSFDTQRLPSSSDAAGPGSVDGRSGPKLSPILVSTSHDVSPAFLREFRSDVSIGRFMNDRAEGRGDLARTIAADFGKEVADLLFGSAHAGGPTGHDALSQHHDDRFQGD